MMQEYDDILREQGLFKDQVTLTRDIKKLTAKRLDYEHAVNRWLWGQTGTPDAYDTAIRVNGKIYRGDSFNAAIEKMLDELGDDGIELSENLKRSDYGYVPKDDVDIFTDVETMHRQRVGSLTEKQRKVYNERKKALDETIAALEQAEKDLDEVTKNPHRFVNAAGNPENYYNRYFDHMAIGEKLEAFTRLIERWYERDNPDGARARAEKTVAQIIGQKAGDAPNRGGMGALNQRALNIPNSWEINDPELGDIAMADFIDNDVLATSEHYIKRVGTRIETARMFGDADMRAEKTRIREYLMDTYFDKQDTDEGRAAVRANIDHVLNLIGINHDAVAGQLRTTSPMRWDNRLANAGRQFTNLTSMGKILFTAIPEIIRPAMTQGFGTAFRSVLLKYFADLEAIKGNLDLNQASGELLEMALLRGNIHGMVNDEAEGFLGNGTWDRWLNDRVNGFFKLSGITSWTVMAKDITMLAAQHNVMDYSRLLAEALEGGTHTAGSREASFRLAAMGISERDALLLARMPIQNHGRLILPAIDNWSGADGQHARALLLRGITAEARRAIVTPSIGDKSTVFGGVLLNRKGERALESDLMMLPMQFMGYGMGAWNRVLVSAVQGRDRSAVSGMFWMLMMGIAANYLRSDSGFEYKDYDQIVAEGFEASGVGGFWLGDLNRQIERMSNNKIGVRPALGIDPAFQDKTKGDVETFLSQVGGAAPSKFYDLSRAFWDTRISGSERAQIIRRGIPYNNLFYWERVFRDMARGTANAFGASQ
jgi:hypothetical protein